ncbi:MAG: protein-L-isoaspartate o-methyltransferase 1 [Thermomicrobiales bacterium]|nr:protein-L-isoaspartate o-methyltransferase 1 [Thermomicrobiales bacterium]
MTDLPLLDETTSYALVMQALESIGGPAKVYRNPRMAFAFNSVRHLVVEGQDIEIRYGEISTPAIATVQGWVWEIHDEDIELLMKPIKKKA